MKKLEEMTSKELRQIAKEMKISGWWNMNKAAMIAEIAKLQEPDVVEEPEIEEIEVVAEETSVEKPETEVVEETHAEEKLTPKRGALIEWNGKSQNICAWGKELGISPNTLYGRIYKMGWSVEKAFTKKPR